MYQYKYITLYTGGGFWLNNSTCEHRQLIDEQAAAGWRYVGFLPTRQRGTGHMQELDLIFEKEENEE